MFSLCEFLSIYWAGFFFLQVWDQWILYAQAKEEWQLLSSSAIETEAIDFHKAYFKTVTFLNTTSLLCLLQYMCAE